MTAYEINGKECNVEYDLDNRIIKVDVDNDDVEKDRRLVGLLDRSVAKCPEGVSSREAATNQYRYDAFGRRIIRKEGSTNSALIWWGNSECAEHKHQAGQTVIQNDIMAHPSRLNSVIARAVDGSKFKLQWYHKNYLDHVYAVSDDDGDILEHYRYTAFGEVTIYDENGQLQNTTQIDNHILWNTRRRDELTGFYLYKYRHYSPELGRWVGRDPIEERGGVNVHAFVRNDSVNIWDYLGLKLTAHPIVEGAHATGRVKDKDRAHLREDSWLGSTKGAITVQHLKYNRKGKNVVELSGENNCCVKIKSSRNYDLTIRTFIANDLVGKNYTANGYNAIKGHEERRRLYLTYAHDGYLEVFDEDILSKCSKCFKKPSDAKSYKARLERWLEAEQVRAQKEYATYVDKWRKKVSGENAPRNKTPVNKLFDSFKVIHTPTEPEHELKPCP